MHRSTVLSAVEEAAIVSLRVQARLPLNDIYIALKDVIPHLLRSSRHRCLQQHGISLLPKTDRKSRSASRHTRSVIFTSTLPNCDTREAKAFSSSLSIGLRRLPLPESIAKRRNSSPQAFSKPLSKQPVTKSIPYSRITAFSSSSTTNGENMALSAISSVPSVRKIASYIARPDPIIPEPMDRPSGWCGQSRKPPSDPSIVPLSPICAAMFGTGYGLTTMSSNSKQDASKHLFRGNPASQRNKTRNLQTKPDCHMLGPNTQVFDLGEV